MAAGRGATLQMDMGRAWVPKIKLYHAIHSLGMIITEFLFFFFFFFTQTSLGLEALYLDFLLIAIKPIE